MRYPLPAIAAGLLLLSAPALAQFPFDVRHVPTAPGPAALFRDGQGRVHTLTAGVDRNFDGRYQPDSGDVSASWFILDAETDAVLDSMSFGCFFSSFPVRVGVDNEGILYVAQLGRIRAFSLADQSLLRDTVVLGQYSGVSWEPIQETLLLHRRPGFSEPGSVVRYSPKSERVISACLVAANPQMSIARLHAATGVPEVYTMSEGTFGTPSTRLAWSSIVEDVIRYRTGVSMLSGAADVLADGGRLFIAETGGRRVHAYRLDGLIPVDVSPIVLPGGAGAPWALALENDSTLLVGTTAGRLLRLDLGDGAIRDSLVMPGPVSALAVSNGLVYAAVPERDAVADSSVLVVQLSNWSIVDTVAVGPEPSQLIVDERGNVFALGQRRTGGNGWWWIIDDTTRTVTHRVDLAGTLAPSFRAAYDAADGGLYVPVGTSVVRYRADSDTGVVSYSDTALFSERGGAFVAVELTDDQYVLTWRPEPGVFAPGAVTIVDRERSRQLATAITGLHPRETVVVPSLRKPDERITAVATINDGLSQPATLSYFAVAPDVLPAQDTIGAGGNHLLASADDTTLIVTLNGSHQLAFFDAEGWQITHRMDTRTTGYDGPRETAEVASSENRVLATACYDGMLRLSWWDNDTAGARGVVATGGKGESVLFRWFPRFKAYVANAFAADYSADTSVAIVEIPLGIRTERDAGSATIGAAHPNPAHDRTSIAIRVAAPERVRLELRSIDGALTRVVFDDALQPGVRELAVPTDGLASGSYLLVLTAGGRVHATPLQVVR